MCSSSLQVCCRCWHFICVQNVLQNAKEIKCRMRWTFFPVAGKIKSYDHIISIKCIKCLCNGCTWNVCQVSFQCSNCPARFHSWKLLNAQFAVKWKRGRWIFETLWHFLHHCLGHWWSNRVVRWLIQVWRRSKNISVFVIWTFFYSILLRILR